MFMGKSPKSWRMLQLVCSGFCEQTPMFARASASKHLDFSGASDIILGYAQVIARIMKTIADPATQLNPLSLYVV
jgi:hypothetical protein